MTILQKIVEHKKQEVLRQKHKFNFNAFEPVFPTKSFYEILKTYKQKNKIALIAEIKKASPSKGVIRKDFDPVEIAETYRRCGAAAISVLTDEEFFQGNIQYLVDVKKNVDIPVLRKDFIIDEFQIHQTKAIGADIILLIAAVLDNIQLRDYLALSEELGLGVLLEIHNRKELDTALEAGVGIIGINNRDLKTFKVDLRNTIELITDEIPENVFIISESGIHSRKDIQLLKGYGVTGVLVGESLMSEDDIETAVINLLK